MMKNKGKDKVRKCGVTAVPNRKARETEKTKSLRPEHSDVFRYQQEGSSG